MQHLGRYRALDLVFDLRTNTTLAQPLRAALIHLETDDAPVDRLTVRRTRRSGWTSRWRTSSNETTRKDDLVTDDGEAFHDVLATISAAVARSASERDAVLHGGAAVIDGRGVVFVGSTGSGTSALVAAAVLDGHSALSDDLTAIDADGRIRTFPRPIGLDSREVLELGLEVPLGPFVPTFPFRATPAPSGADRTELQVVFLVHGGDTDRCERLEPADALVELYRHSVGAEGSERAMFARLERVAKNVPVHLLGWTTPGTAVQQVRRALR